MGKFTLKNVDLAICLDGIGLTGSLNVHLSLPPKEGTLARFFIDALEANNHHVTVNTVQKRLQRSQEGVFAERVFWQHEQFTRELFAEKVNPIVDNLLLI